MAKTIQVGLGPIGAIGFLAIVLGLMGALYAETPVTDEPGSPLERLLDAINVPASDLAPDAFQLLSSPTAGRQLAIYRRLMARPTAAPYRVGLLEAQYAERADSIHRQYMLAAGLATSGVARGYFGNPFAASDRRLVESPDPLVVACEMLALAADAKEWQAELPAIEVLPEPLRLEVARVIAAAASAERFRRRALRKLPPEFEVATVFAQAINGNFGEILNIDGADYRLLLEDVEFEALHSGMLDLVAAVEDFMDFWRNETVRPEIECSFQTPLGVIAINTLRRDDELVFNLPPLLAFDSFGDDHWEVRGPNIARHGGISITIDGEGNDIFEAAGVPAFGAAILGFGLHWDESGDDTYKGKSFTQGAALFGAALFFDKAGDDSYEASSHAQAYAEGGAVLFIDGAGNDRYNSVISSQASAASHAAAVLIDGSGNDHFLLSSMPLLKPAPQSPTHNTSMGQGAATGLRGSLVDGRSLPGGVAVLIDQSGDDVYEAGLFAQGSGYLEGVGLLIDGGGSDHYKAVWYAQGSGAHSAFGGLLDRGDGDDVYNVEQFTGIAAAHDFSVAFLLDEGGNDHYAIRNFGIGAANENGTALFVDVKGDDSYSIALRDGAGLGAAKMDHWGNAREAAPNIGMFFDLGGTDIYTIRREGPGNNALWTWPRAYPDLKLRSESGGGIDGEYRSPFNTRPLTPSSDYDAKALGETLASRRAYREARRQFLQPQAPPQ